VSDEDVKTLTQVCPSCSNDTTGNYCAHCGERVLKSKDDLQVRNFIKDAFHELFDVDSKFIRTLRYLFTKPGFLTLELLQGKKNLYIKPFRLYITTVVLHFLLFSASRSGDIYELDRFPIMQFAPALHEVIKEKEAESGQSHDAFMFALSKQVKDNLSLVLYVVVFLAAGVLYYLYRPFGRYYVEHLYFTLHLFSFAFLRNLFVIPLVMLDLIPLAVTMIIVTQLLYSFIALKKVYPQNNVATALKLFTMLICVVSMFYVSLHICVFVAFNQMEL
jgi:hypothetical protein